MGLIWSMIPEPGQRPGRRIIKKDVATPLTADIAVLDGFLDSQDVLSTEGEVIADMLCERFYKAPGVSRTEVRDGRLVGTLFMPEGKYALRGGMV